MNVKLIAQTIESNLEQIEKLETEIKKVAPDVPKLENYTEDDFVLYLAEQDIYPSDPNFTIYKNHLINKYEKRQEYLTTRDYYITLNNVLDNLVEFYQDNLKDPDSDELDTLAEDTGIRENIDKAIVYINGNIL